MSRRLAAVVIGASAGGLSALQTILGGLPAGFVRPVVVVQHLPATARIDMDLVFGSATDRPLRFIEDKMPLENGAVYFAPPGYHALIEKEGCFSLSLDPPVNFSRPSIDVLFESAARALGPRAMGVILSGANEDGAAGLAAILQEGGTAVVQDPASAEVSMMPEGALRLSQTSEILAVGDIAMRIARWGKEPSSREN